jgi:hypothetical protein
MARQPLYGAFLAISMGLHMTNTASARPSDQIDSLPGTYCGFHINSDEGTCCEGNTVEHIFSFVPRTLTLSRSRIRGPSAYSVLHKLIEIIIEG